IASAVRKPHRATAKLRQFLVLIRLKRIRSDHGRWTTQIPNQTLSIGRPVPRNKALVIGSHWQQSQVLLTPRLIHVEDRVHEVAAEEYLRAVRRPEWKRRIARS